jgi:hypothetical protein
MAESDFSASCIIGYDSSSSRCGPAGITPLAKPEISRFPHKELPHMPGSPTTPGWAGTRDDAPDHVAFRDSDHVGTQNFLAFAAQWLAYALPYRRFADTLTSANARLGADADRYSFIVVDLHLLLLAGFDRRTRSSSIRSVPSLNRMGTYPAVAHSTSEPHGNRPFGRLTTASSDSIALPDIMLAKERSD